MLQVAGKHMEAIGSNALTRHFALKQSRLATPEKVAGQPLHR